MCVHYAPYKATSSTFNPLCLHLLFFMHLLICFELNNPEIEKHYKWTLKRLKLGMVSSYRPHSMCKKVEWVTAKTGCTSCTNWTLSFEVSGFRTKTHLLQKALHFLELITTPDFLCVHYAAFKATSSTFNPFRLHLLFFMHLLICFELNDPEIENHYKWTLKRLKLGMVSSCHPHSMCKKVERVTAKTGCTSCTKWTISFKVSGFWTKTHLLQRHFIF